MAAAGAVAVFALATTVSGLGNDFAYDDREVIVGDPALHSPGTAVPRAFAPYLGGQLLRPVPLLAFAAQWSAGGGSPLTFRIVSLVLYAGVSVLVLLLLRRAGAPPGAALAGALVFAVHPVHSEVTANAVGQLELLAAFAVTGAVVYYLGARTAPVWRRRDTLALALLCLIATHAKESAYVLPGLLVAGELLVVTDRRPWQARLATLREPALALLAVVLGSLAIRNYFLGEMGGGLPHASLEGMQLADRAVGFLGVVPEWFRLLLWPVRLQAEYGPPALDPTAPFGAGHLLGIGLLAVTVAGLISAWRQAPLIAFGLVWAALALAPVANLFFPTGILVAERTLFLPSVGLAIAVAGAAEALWTWLGSRPHLRPVPAGLGAIVLVAGAWRSAVRQPDWRDTQTVLELTAQASPRTYRAHLLLGREQRDLGNLAAAEESFRRAGGLWARDPRPFEELGQLLRARGECGAAIPVLRRGVEADSSSDTARSRLIECLIVERRWDEAEREIDRGLAQGVRAYENARTRVRARRLVNPTG
jgi:hypothetical protein